MVHEMIHLCFNCFHYYAKTAMHSVLVRKRAFTYNHRLYIKEGGSKEGDAEEVCKHLTADCKKRYCREKGAHVAIGKWPHEHPSDVFFGFFVSTQVLLLFRPHMLHMLYHCYFPTPLSKKTN